MPNKFLITELLLYILPFVLIYFGLRYGKFFLKRFKNLPLTIAIVLLPAWLGLIDSLSKLVFSFSLLPVSIYLTVFCLAVHLYKYIQGLAEFRLVPYYLAASKVAFTALSGFLLGLYLVRIYTYFI